MNLENISLDSWMGIQLKIYIFRTETYNRVDKINMNNPKIVSPEKTGKNHFTYADDIKQPKSR